MENNKSSETPISTIPSPIPEVRQRKPVTASVSPPVTKAVPQRSFFYTSTDYITLAMMWIITAVLVVLVVRRLAMEKENMTGSA